MANNNFTNNISLEDLYIVARTLQKNAELIHVALGVLSTKLYGDMELLVPEIDDDKDENNGFIPAIYTALQNSTKIVNNIDFSIHVLHNRLTPKSTADPKSTEDPNSSDEYPDSLTEKFYKAGTKLPNSTKPIRSISPYKAKNK